MLRMDILGFALKLPVEEPQGKLYLRKVNPLHIRSNFARTSCYPFLYRNIIKNTQSELQQSHIR